MIFQLLINPSVKTVSNIPFSGRFNIKILSIEFILSGNDTLNFYITSDRIPFSIVKWIPFNNESGTQNTALTSYSIEGLQLCNRFLFNIGNQLGTVAFHGYDRPIIINDVFLDGYLDFQFFSSGTSGAMNASPPPSMGAGSRCLMTFDFEEITNF